MEFYRGDMLSTSLLTYFGHFFLNHENNLLNSLTYPFGRTMFSGCLYAQRLKMASNSLSLSTASTSKPTENKGNTYQFKNHESLFSQFVLDAKI